MPKYFFLIVCLSISCYCFSFAHLVSAGERMKIVVNLPGRMLQLYEGDQVKKEFPVGIGTRSSKTPIGRFKVIAKEINPIWISPVKGNEQPIIIKSGPNNPLGYRWIEFAELYGIHGTNDPSSIGHYVSNGCIRMHESDVETLYELVPLNTPVEIVYQRVWINKNETGCLMMSIYPDGYGIQQISAKEVYDKLSVEGVQDFVDREQLAQALRADHRSDFFIGRTFSLMMFGKAIAAKAVERNGEIFFPVIPLATEAMVSVTWEKEKSLLHSAYGSVAGYDHNDVLYIKEKDLYKLLHIYSASYDETQMLYLDYDRR